jgi:hypothetical protein
MSNFASGPGEAVDSFQAKKQTLDDLRLQVAKLEAEIREEESAAAARQWPPRGFYSAYYANSGFMLGGIAAIASLVLNILGASLVGENPLELIRVYLTFPLGARALELGPEHGSLILLLGCCLYIATGVVLGVPFFVALAKWSGEGLKKRLLTATVLALLLWIINFYGILAWLQPALFGGNWITDPAVLPPWVAAGTHLVFGWTLAVLYPLGRFVPYQPRAQVQS